MSLKYFDTHAHLPMLEHATPAEILTRAEAAGVDRFVTVSTDPESWQKNREVAEKSERIFYSLGIHPHEAVLWQANKTRFLEYFSKGVPPRCVAIGEVGLDYFYKHSPPEVQKAVFKEQIALAKQYDLPLIIHCRDAFKDLFDCLDAEGTPPKTGVMHCFTGTLDEAVESVRRGFYVSYSGIVTFKTAGPLRETLRAVPFDRIVLETDCPFLAPIPHRGKPNEPGLLPHTAMVVASTLGVPVAEVAQQTYQNALRLFHLNT